MDSSSYKDITTSRGLVYHYYLSPAKSGLPTLLLQHGFPSTSRDWHHLVSRLLPHGYGLIVPDLLGYGGTSKPEAAEDYEYSLISQDVVDILDAEGIDRVVSVGYDWGSVLASRLYNYFPERVSAGVFLAVPYIEPGSFNLDEVNSQSKQFLGYELYGYWYFLTEPDAHNLIAEHWDSFFSIIFPVTPELWKTDLAPIGKLKEWLLANKTSPRPSYLSEKELKDIRDSLTHGPGLKGALNWYKSMMTGINTDNAKPVPEKSHYANVPVFFGAALYDYCGNVQFAKQSIEKGCKHPDTIIHEYDSDHWVIFSHVDSIAVDLVEWIEGLRGKGIV